MKKAFVVTSLLPLLFLSVILGSIFLATPLAYVRGNPGGHISVTNSPVPVGQPIHIQFSVDPGDTQAVSLYIKNPGGGADLWDYNVPYAVIGGTTYTENAPGLGTPGTYTAGIIEFVGGVASSYAETTFQVGSGGGGGPGFDFTLAFSPSTLSVTAGGVANFPIIITYNSPAYSGTNINVQPPTGLGPGMNYQLIPSPPTLSISTSPSTPAGTYPITLIGYANGVTHQASGILIVQVAQQIFDFSILVSPGDRNLTPGGSTTYAVSVNLVSGTSQSVALSVPDAPAGVTVAFSQSSGNPSFTSTLSVSTLQSMSPGKYALTVTGNGGGKVHTAPVALIIGASPDFRIEASPPSQTVSQGQTASYSVHVVGLNSFNSQISLTVSGLPAGVNGVFSNPSASPDFSSTLTLAIPGNSPTGSFTLTITGSGGGITRIANVILIVNPTQTQSQTQPTAQASSTATGGLPDLLQQNGLIIIAVLALAAVLLAALAMRGRGRRAPSQQMGPPQLSCGKCGTVNPPGNEFCANCGQRLR